MKFIDRVRWKMLYAIFFPVRAINMRRKTEVNLRQEMLKKQSLKVSTAPDRICISPSSKRHQNEIGAKAIVNWIPHFESEVEKWVPWSESEKAAMQTVASSWRPRARPTFKMPVEYRRQSDWHDEKAFEVFAQKLTALPDLVALGELRDAAEAAYLDTRPADFDFHAYFRDNR